MIAREMALRALERKIRKIDDSRKHRRKREKIKDAFGLIALNSTTAPLNEIRGVGVLAWLFNSEGIDCFNYAFGDADLKDVLVGILEHSRDPEPGDIIIYGTDKREENIFPVSVLMNPKHMGVWQPDGTVISKWGKGPLVKHKWDLVLPEYGDYIFFSTYKGRMDYSDLVREVSRAES